MSKSVHELAFGIVICFAGPWQISHCPAASLLVTQAQSASALTDSEIAPEHLEGCDKLCKIVIATAPEPPVAWPAS